MRIVFSTTQFGLSTNVLGRQPVTSSASNRVTTGFDPSNNPHLLRMEYGPVRASRITAAWAEQKAVREIMVFLHSHGVGTARAVRIYKTYGPDAIQVMTENPYRLPSTSRSRSGVASITSKTFSPKVKIAGHASRDIRGIGFKTADAIAMKLGIEKTAMVRVRAGISYALTEAMDEGHCGLPTEELIPLAEKLLEVSQELIRSAPERPARSSRCKSDTMKE
jgi:exodeoxyribonuclease V alpha subunit